MLLESERNRGAEGVGPIAVHGDDRNTPTLAEMGVTKDQSSKWQQVAALPEAGHSARTVI